MSEALVTSTTRGSWVRRGLPALVAGGGALAIAAWNPGDDGIPFCFSRHLFGIDCPACGGLRTVNSLMHGDLIGAADHNVLLALLLPLTAIVWLAWFVEPLTGRRITIPDPPRWMIVSIAVLLGAFTVVRNMGGPAWAQWLASGSYG